MKISAALAIFSMAYVSSTAKVIQQAIQLANSPAAVPATGQQATGFPSPSLLPAVSSGSQTVTAGVASHSDTVSHGTATVGHGTTTQHSARQRMNAVFPGGAYYNTYFPGAYLGSFTGAFPSFYNGASHDYVRATYPGLSTGAFSRYFREVFPGIFRRAYRRLYRSRLLGYGAAGRFPMGSAGNQVGFTGNPLTGQPALSPISGATGGRFSSSYPVQGPVPQPGQLPGPFPVGTTPGVSATTSVGTATVSQGQLGAPVAGGSAVISSQQQNLVRHQSPLQLSHRSAE